MEHTHYLIRVTYSNGFPYPEYKQYDSLDAAMQAFQDQKTPQMTGLDINQAIDAAGYTEENQSGNGLTIAVLAHDAIIDALQKQAQEGYQFTDDRTITFNDGTEVVLKSLLIDETFGAAVGMNLHNSKYIDIYAVAALSELDTEILIDAYCQININ